MLCTPVLLNLANKRKNLTPFFGLYSLLSLTFYQWWPRPLQFVQWTISSSPHHPIFIDVLRRISLANAQASTWLAARTKLVDQLRAEGKVRQAADVQNLDVFETKGTENEYAKTLGPGVSVMEWTGPGVWTDSVMSYLKTEYGLSWPAFKDLRSTSLSLFQPSQKSAQG